MPQKSMNEELYSRKEGRNATRKRWIRDVDEEIRMMIIRS
jgi:hypothetical protein